MLLSVLFFFRSFCWVKFSSKANKYIHCNSSGTLPGLFFCPLPGVGLPSCYTSTAGGWVCWCILLVGVLWWGLPLRAVLVVLYVFRPVVMFGGLPLIASGLFCLWFVRVFFGLVRLSAAGCGRSEGHPRRGKHRRTFAPRECFK